MNAEDVQGMVECSIAMLEPLPPIDVDRFTKEVESLYWELMYASKDELRRVVGEGVGRACGSASRGWRGATTSRSTWTRLRLFRATFLYDTVMFRLWKELDLDEEYQRYFRRSSGAARRSGCRRTVAPPPAQAVRGTTGTTSGSKSSMRMGNQMLGRIQQFLDTPNVTTSRA
jgi:hypothetical protein